MIFGACLLFLAGGLYKKRRFHLVVVAIVSAANVMIFASTTAHPNSDSSLVSSLSVFLQSVFVFGIAVFGLAKHKAIRDRR
jgi:hypothetical protein